MAGIYDFKIKTREGGEVSLSDYKGKVLLIVNTATGVGLRHSMRDWKNYIASITIRGWKFWIFRVISLGIRRQGRMRRFIIFVF